METKPFKLPEPFLTNWKEALRSGNYKQAQGKLLTTKVLEDWGGGDDDYDDYEDEEDVPDFDPTSQKSYCCLGIAGKICDIEELHMYNVEVFDNNIPTSSRKKIPSELDDSAITNRLVRVLTSMNDGIRWTTARELIESNGVVFRKKFTDDFPVRHSFKEIADWLDDNVEGYGTS